MIYQYDNAPKVTGAVITVTTLAFLCLGLRVYTRLRNKTWGIDDYSMAFAGIPFLGLSIACLGGSFRGIGIHESRLTAPEISEALHWFFFFEVFYCATIIPIKLGISFMLMRIAEGRKPFIMSLWVANGIFTTMNLIALFYIIFQCSPVQYAWDTSIKGKCAPAKGLADIYYATTAVNIATDWFCAVMPIPLLWNVQLNRNAKISVAILLGLGALASLSACIRLNYTINLTNSQDYLFGVADIVLWGYCENGIGMIVGCISTLRPLFRKLFNLGDSTNNPSHGLGRSGANSRLDMGNKRNKNQYQEFEMGFELPDTHSGDTLGLTTVKGGETISMDRKSFSSESQEYILNDGKGPSGIKMTRSVDVSFHHH